MSTSARRRPLNLDLLSVAGRIWATEVLVSGFNFFVLMALVYEPRWGELRAHQIGMTTRIVYIFLFAYLLLRYSKGYETRDLVQVGFLWLGLTLIFEWGGSLAIGRPVREILIGWQVWKGYLWPFVLLTYFCAKPDRRPDVAPLPPERGASGRGAGQRVRPGPRSQVSAARCAHAA